MKRTVGPARTHVGIFLPDNAARHYFHLGKLFGGPRIEAVHKVISRMGFCDKSMLE